MATAEHPVEDLLDAVKRLPPAALAEFTARLTEWQESTEAGPDESFLVQQTGLCLSPDDAQRLRQLARRSERGELDAAELNDYRKLARRAEQITAARVQALAELARRRNQPVRSVKQQIGWQELDHGA